ncbi:hypothetical protein C0Z16_00145 [Paraburkholderia rhynchosiae]|uniref:Oligogalacturonate lyase n=1 Tax=Paraburkholderia rhynchosiae TaxID=487049 RepID=A0ABX4VD02_9BURK|nr:hypothetical protein C0Z16_00145 [Paraburkholderia rhynchosiae]
MSRPCPVRRLGSREQHHFFGYYNKTAWDRTGRRVLGNHVAMMDARLTPELKVNVGYFDLQDSQTFRALDTTTAWNWQMGCQLQWLDGEPGRKLIYNTRSGDMSARYPGFGSTILDVDSGAKTALPMPVYVTAPDSRYALCVDYRRLYATHETIGYSEHGGPFPLPLAPADDGINRMDLATGEVTLVVSYDDLRNFQRKASMERAIHWVSHIEINPASSRVLFLHRWTERTEDETCFLHRLITMYPDGSGMRLLECSDHPLPQLADDFDPSAVGTFDYEKSEYQISHPLWQDDSHIVVWAPRAGSIHYHLYEDRDDGRVEAIGRDVLTENGHMSFSPVDARWLLSDTYPDTRTNTRALFLYDMQDGVRYDIGEFYTPAALKKENRCDLHPRWRRDGLAVCIDSVHEGARQMYVIDVSTITGAR